MRILVAEDDPTSAILLKSALSRAGHEVVVVKDGQEALDQLKESSFQLLMTDWMMPRVDGIELIHRLRDDLEEPPLIIMITALASSGARSHALESGADEFLTKPFKPKAVLEAVDGLIARRGLTKEDAPAEPEKGEAPLGSDTGARGPSPAAQAKSAETKPPFPAIALVASSGGPTAFREVFRRIPRDSPATYIVVMQGQPWVVEAMVPRLQQETPLDVRLASEGDEPRPGQVWFAPGDWHLAVEDKPLRFVLNQDDKENFVRPSADVLFRSVAAVFGRHSACAVLTGAGRDGAAGVVAISEAGGRVVVQEPRSAVASAMPQAALSTGVDAQVLTLSGIGEALASRAEDLVETLDGVAAPPLVGTRGAG